MIIALAGDRAGALCVLIGARQHCAAQPGGQTGENRTRKALSGKRARKKQSARLLGDQAVKSEHDPDDSQTVFWGAFGREHDSGFHPGRCGDAQRMVPQRLSLSCPARQARGFANAKRPNRRTDSAAPVSGQGYPVSMIQSVTGPSYFLLSVYLNSGMALSCSLVPLMTA